jgi:hypothetical protein
MSYDEFDEGYDEEFEDGEMGDGVGGIMDPYYLFELKKQYQEQRFTASGRVRKGSLTWNKFLTKFSKGKGKKLKGRFEMKGKKWVRKSSGKKIRRQSVEEVAKHKGYKFIEAYKPKRSVKKGRKGSRSVWQEYITETRSLGIEPSNVFRVASVAYRNGISVRSAIDKIEKGILRLPAKKKN